MSNNKYPIGSKVRFWCTSYRHLKMPDFWSYGVILRHGADELTNDDRYPYYIKWMENNSSYNGLGTQAWWSTEFEKENPLELIQDPNEVLKEIL